MLILKQVEVFYQHVIQVLKGISLSVNDGQIVSLLGANGAGKTTTLKAISCLLTPEDGRVTDGTIEYDGRRIDKLKAHHIAKLGILQVHEGRRVFEYMSVEENVRSGHIFRNESVEKKMKVVYELFPQLSRLRNKKAGWLSGGEQQMMVIGRCLMGEPRMMLLDEPSLGLAPMLVEIIFETIAKINQKNKASMLIVEQNAARALSISEYGYVMENGRIVMDGPSEKLRENPDIKEFYLGFSDLNSRRSYRDVKHYKRRKRWL